MSAADGIAQLWLEGFEQGHQTLGGGRELLQQVRPAGERQPAERQSRADLRIDVVTGILGGWVWETDAEHRFVYMSPSVERYAGKPPEWHYGKTRQELGNTSVSTADGRPWTEQLATREAFGPVDFIRYQEGEALWMRTMGEPQFDVDGKFTGYIGIAFELPGDESSERVDRRGAPRRRIVRAAEIRAVETTGDVACVLSDISASGARIKVPPGVHLPEQFRLTVHSLSLDRRCELRWRRDGEIGVAFVD